MFQFFILIEIIWIFSEFSSFNLIWQNFVILTYKKSGASILVDILTPGLPVITNSRSLHKLMSIESVMPSSHLILCRPFLLLPPIPPSIRVFPISQLFASGGPSIGVSASASVLPMNTQDWTPLRWTGWISLQSKGLSRVFSNTTVQKHQFFGAQLSSQSNSHIYTWPLEKP